MEYYQAIEKALNDMGVELISTPFRLRAILSDYVGNNFYAKQLIDVIFKVTKSINLLDIFNSNSLLEARNILGIAYKSSFRKDIMANDFVNAINPISKFIFPNEFQTSRPQGSINNNKACAVKTNNGNKLPIQKAIPVSRQQTLANKQSTVNKPQKKRTTVKNAVALLFTANADTVTFKTNNGDDYQIIVDGEVIKDGLKGRYLVSFIMMQTFNYPGKDLIISIPRKHYVSIDLHLNCRRAFIGDFDNDLIDAGHLGVTMKKGYLNIAYYGGNLETDLGRVDVKLNGSFEELSGKQDSGQCMIENYVSNNEKMVMNYINNNGPIVVRVHDTGISNSDRHIKHSNVGVTFKRRYKDVDYDFNFKCPHRRVLLLFD